MHHYETGLLILMFVTFALLVGSMTRHLLKNVGIPYTVVLLVIGIALGLLERVHTFEAIPEASATLELVANIDAHLILFLFLPTLIFESAFAMEVHLFRRIFSQIAILAVPGLIVATLATAVLIKFAFPWDWSWTVCLIFGALISATDPVAVVAVLKEVSSRKRLETLIEGESLLNDGTAIVLFSLFLGWLTAEGSGGFNLFAVGGQFVWVVALGLVIGLILGGLTLLWIGRIFNDPMIEISLSIALAYLAFMVAEHAFHVSGVVAIVAAALLFAGIGRTRISPEVAGFLHHFWEMMAHIANTLIFLLVGILVAARVPLNSPQLWLALGILYIGVLIIRGGCIGLFTPLLKRISIGFNRDKALVLWWGGLRGAVSLSLALVLAQGGYLPEELGSQVLFLCAGVVVLTILINGSTMEWLLAKLNLNALPPAKQATVDKARGVIQGELKEFLPQLTSDEFLQQANWENVRERLNLNEEAVEQPKEAKADASKEDLAIAFRRRILETERKHYWWQFNRGTLRRRSTQKLVEAVEHALDGDPEINPRKELFDLLQMPPIVRLLAKSPRFNQLLLRMTFTRLALGYDVVRGFMLAQEEIAKHVDALAPSPEEAQFVADQILQNKRDTYEQLTQFQESFPELIQILESFSATRLLLNRQRMVIQRLLSEAVLDAPEGERLIQEVEHHMAQLGTLPAEVPAADPSDLIRQSSWVQGINPTTLEKLMNAINQRIYSAGDTIMKQGSSGGSLGILLRGTTEVVEIEGDQEKVTEILGPGSLVGLMSLITGINPHTVKAAAFVDILWLDATDLKPLMSSDATLASNLTQLMTKGTEH